MVSIPVSFEGGSAAIECSNLLYSSIDQTVMVMCNQLTYAIRNGSVADAKLAAIPQGHSVLALSPTAEAALTVDATSRRGSRLSRPFKPRPASHSR